MSRDKFGQHITHTQDMVVVYVSREEKEQIRKSSGIVRKSMSRYLLDLHLNRSIGPPEPPRPKNHHPVA